MQRHLEMGGPDSFQLVNHPAARGSDQRPPPRILQCAGDIDCTALHAAGLKRWEYLQNGWWFGGVTGGRRDTIRFRFHSIKTKGSSALVDETFDFNTSGRRNNRIPSFTGYWARRRVLYGI